MGRCTASSRAASDCRLFTRASNCALFGHGKFKLGIQQIQRRGGSGADLRGDRIAGAAWAAAKSCSSGQARAGGAKTFHRAVNAGQHFGLQGVEAGGGLRAARGGFGNRALVPVEHGQFDSQSQSSRYCRPDRTGSPD